MLMRVDAERTHVGGATDRRPAVMCGLEDPRWIAVLARDAGADGTFVFGVRSTGIYCRPSCPARRPGRAQVVFFARPSAAEHAGFRACRRCRPNEAGASRSQVQLVEAACRYIEAHVDGETRLRTLAAHLAHSPHHVHRVFRRLVGITPREYADACRLDLVRARLRAQEAVAAAVYDAGFGSSSRLYERAPKHLGMTPAAYRRGGRGTRVGYVTVATPLGRLLVGATSRGVCAVSLGRDDATLEAALAAEYPTAERRRDDARLGPWVAAIVEHLRGRRPHLSLPLDIQATAFQRRVWAALQSIPYGETRSYGEVARALGAPSATRAVARACATNPAALVIPCHRVIRADGDLGGYRWGVARKAALLRRERRGVRAPGGVRAAALAGHASREHTR
ncbi:MAG TPA: bifunctional DNA-binding transcriptional regulator/O6-methylguanine-DNA methyltransferase Ada [bacterium]|nr:bifunctional DNA-binding transcriptional regulator/O6-methylguanine-DNA methyltransferase Ada [bacterium]